MRLFSRKFIRPLKSPRAIEWKITSARWPNADASSVESIAVAAWRFASQLRPVDHIYNVDCPVFVISGENDRNTRHTDTRMLVERALNPKEVWFVPNAGHVDLHRAARQEYETRVLAFLAGSEKVHHENDRICPRNTRKDAKISGRRSTDYLFITSLANFLSYTSCVSWANKCEGKNCSNGLVVARTWPRIRSSHDFRTFAGPSDSFSDKGAD